MKPLERIATVYVKNFVWVSLDCFGIDQWKQLSNSIDTYEALDTNELL